VAVPEPAAHVARLIDPHLEKSDLADQFPDPRATRCFGAGRRRCGGERSLPRQGQLVGALDVTSGGADALVREQAREGVLHGLHTNPLDGGGREGDTSSWMSAS